MWAARCAWQGLFVHLPAGRLDAALAAVDDDLRDFPREDPLMSLAYPLAYRAQVLEERGEEEAALAAGDACEAEVRRTALGGFVVSLVVQHHDWRSPEELERLYVRYARGEGFFYAKHLRRGDLRMLRFVGRDLAWGVRAIASGLLKGRESWTDSRRGVFKGMPAGFWAGWRAYGKER